MTRVGIVYPRANIDTVPSLVGAAELLAAHGYEVDLLILTSAGQPLPRFVDERIRVRSLGVEGLAEHSTAGLRGVVRRAGWLPGAARAPLARGYAALGAGLAHGSRFVARVRARTQTKPEGYVCLIGVDPDGLVLAASLADGAPVAYYSLELLLSDELTTPAEQRLKVQERVLSQAAPFIVVQDADRGRLLADDNAIDADRVALVPNAPPGPARRAPSRYWHARFNLAEGRRVVLHAGSLGDWTGIEDLVRSVPAWPEPWVLVVHTRYDAETSPYVERLRAQADPERVLFSLKPVDRQAYDVLIDGADVGLAFYVATGDSSFTRRNVQTIGLSSGKLAYYLRAGLPTIVNGAASIAAPIERAGCGVAVDGAEDVGAGLAQVGANYAQYSAAACRFFEQHLDFARAFGTVIDRIDTLAVRA
jgi:glycosyltransferase involved in cell wall biosynthesis